MTIKIVLQEKIKGYFIKNTPEAIKQADETYALISKIEVPIKKESLFKQLINKVKDNE